MYIYCVRFLAYMSNIHVNCYNSMYIYPLFWLNTFSCLQLSLHSIHIAETTLIKFATAITAITAITWHLMSKKINSVKQCVQQTFLIMVTNITVETHFGRYFSTKSGEMSSDQWPKCCSLLAGYLLAANYATAAGLTFPEKSYLGGSRGSG